MLDTAAVSSHLASVLAVGCWPWTHPADFSPLVMALCRLWLWDRWLLRRYPAAL